MTSDFTAPGTGSGRAGTIVEPFRGRPAEWDDFVRRTPGGTFFHLNGWKELLTAVFHFSPHYLVARREGRIVGVLPLFELREGRRARCLLSVPFAVEGGVCAEDPEALEALDSAVLQAAHARGAAYIELRDGRPGPGAPAREGLYFRFRRRLFATEAENFAAIPRKQRRMIRRGERSGLVSRIGHANLELFYDLYARTMRRHGTPVFSLRYFRTLVDEFPDQTLLLTVWHESTPVAGVLSFLFGDTVLPYYAGSRHEYFRYAVNDFMYWELMRTTLARGARMFDFGRSKKGTGAFDFKRHWGFEPEPMRYRVFLCGSDAPVERTVDDAAVRLLRAVWRRLPLGVTKLLGPHFVQRYGPYYT